jgi:hypothetical protein
MFFPHEVGDIFLFEEERGLIQVIKSILSMFFLHQVGEQFVSGDERQG